MSDQTELIFLISMVSQLKEVIGFLLDFFVKEGVSENSIYPVRLLRNRLEELFEKLLLVRKGVSEDSICPLKGVGNQLEELFEKLVKESRQSLDKQDDFDKQQISIVLYKKILAELHKSCEDELLVVIDDIIPKVSLDPETREIIERLKSFLQTIKDVTG